MEPTKQCFQKMLSVFLFTLLIFSPYTLEYFDPPLNSFFHLGNRPKKRSLVIIAYIQTANIQTMSRFLTFKTKQNKQKYPISVPSEIV